MQEIRLQNHSEVTQRMGESLKFKFEIDNVNFENEINRELLNCIESEPWHYKPCAKLEIAIFLFQTLTPNWFCKSSKFCIRIFANSNF
jgi:hypothetical protein